MALMNKSDGESIFSNIFSGWGDCARKMFETKERLVSFAEPEVKLNIVLPAPAPRNFVILVCR